MIQKKRGKYERLDAAIPIEILFVGQVFGSHTVMCDNIGGKGFRFSFDQKVEVNSPLELIVHLPDDQPPLRTKGRVSWVREAKLMAGGPKTLFDVGVEFLALRFQDKDRIHQYIYQRVQRQKPERGI